MTHGLESRIQPTTVEQQQREQQARLLGDIGSLSIAQVTAAEAAKARFRLLPQIFSE